MNQRLRSLIVIINLIPSCLCFAQEGANKTTSATPAQKPETELQRQNSTQGQNTTVVLPDGMGAFQKVEISPEANSWAIQIITRGGFDGKGNGDLTITSQGHLAWNERKNQCNIKLRDDVLQMLTQTAFSADASKWVGLPSMICADCFKTAIVLQRREGAGIVRMYMAYWDDGTAGKISEGWSEAVKFRRNRILRNFILRASTLNGRAKSL